MEDLKTFLIDKVLLFESDTLPSETERVLQQVRRDRTNVPVIHISSNTSSIIAGSDKTFNAVKLYIEENEPTALMVRVGCSAPANYEPLVCIQMPGKNKLFLQEHYRGKG